MSRVRVTAALSLLLANTSGVRYKCTFGPDFEGNTHDEVVLSAVAQNCGDFCVCEGLMENTCHFGPDIAGYFIVEEVSSERADSCDPNFCICDTHDFTDTRYQVANLDWSQPNTFELELAAR